MIIFEQFKHLLPNARAWRLTIDKNLRRFFQGLADGLTTQGGFEGPIEFLDRIHEDVFPTTTRQLAEYEAQFGLTAGSLTESERRIRLAAEWAATGGQSPGYIQGVVQANGFNVFIHEWWIPSTNTAREPAAFITDPEFMLVNKIETAQPNPVGLGKGFGVGGVGVGVGAVLGTELITVFKPIPTDPDTWPFFLYFGGETFGDFATVPAARRNEFEALLLKLCPTQLWIGLRVNYI